MSDATLNTVDNKTGQQNFPLTVSIIPEFSSLPRHEIAFSPYLTALVVVQSGTSGEPRVPLHLCMCVDQSGSMSGSRIREAREASHTIIDQLREDDQIDIIAYNSEPRLLASGSGAEKNMLHEKIDTLQASGSTNISEALRMAYTTLHQSKHLKHAKRVFLLSDGQPTSGLMGTEELGRVAQPFAERDFNISTFGIGTGISPEIMMKIADSGNGHYDFVSERRIQELINKAFRDLSRLMGSRSSLSLAPSSGVKFAEVTEGEIGEYTQVGDFKYEATTRFITRVSLDQMPSAATNGEVAFLKAEFTFLVPDKPLAPPVTVTGLGKINIVDGEDAARSARDPTVAVLMTMRDCGRLFEKIDNHLEQGATNDAITLLKEVVSELEKHMDNDLDGMVHVQLRRSKRTLERLEVDGQAGARRAQLEVQGHHRAARDRLSIADFSSSNSSNRSDIAQGGGGGLGGLGRRGSFGSSMSDDDLDDDDDDATSTTDETDDDLTSTES